jgi:hypothetical protein
MRSCPSRLGICLSIAMIACLYYAENACAQTAATIVGDITDSNGAVAPNVTVTVINEGTKIERRVQTNDAGHRVTTQSRDLYHPGRGIGFKREVRSAWF